MLANLTGHNRLDFLHVDAEGRDFEVVAQFLQHGTYPRYIKLEWGIPDEDRIKLLSFMDFLACHGYDNVDDGVDLYSFYVQPSASTNSCEQMPLEGGVIGGKKEENEEEEEEEEEGFSVPGVRFVVDGLMDKAECRKFRMFFDRNPARTQTTANDWTDTIHDSFTDHPTADFFASEIIDFRHDPDFPALLALRQTMIDRVQSWFRNVRTQVGFTHFIRRTPSPNGMGAHADNCKLMLDRHGEEICGLGGGGLLRMADPHRIRIPF